MKEENSGILGEPKKPTILDEIGNGLNNSHDRLNETLAMLDSLDSILFGGNPSNENEKCGTVDASNDGKLVLLSSSVNRLNDKTSEVFEKLRRIYRKIE